MICCRCAGDESNRSKSLSPSPVWNCTGYNLSPLRPRCRGVLTWFSMFPGNLECGSDYFIIEHFMSDSDLSACFEGFANISEGSFFLLHTSLHRDIHPTSITDYRLEPHHTSIGHALC